MFVARPEAARFQVHIACPRVSGAGYQYVYADPPVRFYDHSKEFELRCAGEQ